MEDRTSFDAFISYIIKGNNKKGMLGIEVKYTEGGYSPTKREKAQLEDEGSKYFDATNNSRLYKNAFVERLKENSYRQIWRNHLLAYKIAEKYKFDEYKSVTIYHEGNTHFEKAFKDYQPFLTDEGKKTLADVTYSEFLKVLYEHIKTEQQKSWVKYLKERYDVGSNG